MSTALIGKPGELQGLVGAPEGPAKAPSCVLPPVTRPGAHTATATTVTRYEKCAKATRRVAVPASTMQGTLAAPYRARRTSERAERAHLCVGVREQQIGSLPASPEVTTAWTRAPESPTAQLAGCRIPKAQNPRLRIPIPKSPKSYSWVGSSQQGCLRGLFAHAPRFALS